MMDSLLRPLGKPVFYRQDSPYQRETCRMLRRQEIQPPKTRRLPSRAVAARYGVSMRTLDRWLDAEILPPPLVINRYRYWAESELDRFDQARMDAQRERARVTQ